MGIVPYADGAALRVGIGVDVPRLPPSSFTIDLCAVVVDPYQFSSITCVCMWR